MSRDLPPFPQGPLIPPALVVAAPSAPAPLSVRLRALVIDMACEATLTCTFAPGGQFNGVGICSHFYCQHCRQARHWHEVAEAAALAAAVEDGARRASVEEHTHAHRAERDVVGA